MSNRYDDDYFEDDDRYEDDDDDSVSGSTSNPFSGRSSVRGAGLNKPSPFSSRLNDDDDDDEDEDDDDSAASSRGVGGPRPYQRQPLGGGSSGSGGGLPTRQPPGSSGSGGGLPTRQPPGSSGGGLGSGLPSRQPSSGGSGNSGGGLPTRQPPTERSGGGSSATSPFRREETPKSEDKSSASRSSSGSGFLGGSFGAKLTGADRGESKGNDAPKASDKKDDKPAGGGLGGALGGLGGRLAGGSQKDDAAKKDDKPAGGALGGALGGLGNRFGGGGQKDDAAKKDDKPAGGALGGALGGLGNRFGGGGQKDDKPAAKKDDKPAGGALGGALGGLGNRFGGGGQKDDKSAAKPADKPSGGGLGGAVGGALGGLGSRFGGGQKDDKSAAKPAGKPSGGGLGGTMGGLGNRFGGGQKDDKPAARPGAAASAGSAAPKQSPLGTFGRGSDSTAKPGDKKAGDKKAAGAQSVGQTLQARLRSFLPGGGGESKAASKTRAQRGAPKIDQSGLSLDQKLDILGWGLFLGSIILILSSLSPNQGALLAPINAALSQMFGWGAPITVVIIGAIGIWLLIRHFGDEAPSVSRVRLIGLAMLFIGVLTAFQFGYAIQYEVGAGQDYLEALRNVFLPITYALGQGGGWIGGEIYYLLLSNIGEAGAFILLVGWLVVSAMLVLSLSAADVAAITMSNARNVRDAQRRISQRRAVRRAERQQALALAAAAAAAQVEDAAPEALPAGAPNTLPAPAQAALPAPEEERSIPITTGGRTSTVTFRGGEPVEITQNDVRRAAGQPAPAAQRGRDGGQDGNSNSSGIGGVIAGGVVGNVLGRLRSGRKDDDQQKQQPAAQRQPQAQPTQAAQPAHLRDLLPLPTAEPQPLPTPQAQPTVNPYAPPAQPQTPAPNPYAPPAQQPATPPPTPTAQPQQPAAMLGDQPVKNDAPIFTEPPRSGSFGVRPYQRDQRRAATEQPTTPAAPPPFTPDAPARQTAPAAYGSRSAGNGNGVPTPPPVPPREPIAGETGERRINPPTMPAPTPPAPPRRPNKDWKMPSLAALLTSGDDQEIDHEILLKRAHTIEETLESFGAPGRVVDVRTGPVVTQFGVEPDYIEGRGGKKNRVKVGAIAALDKDLQLALGAKSIRIEAPVPGKGYVGIEVPNEKAEIVHLRDVMESENFKKIKSPLAIGLGQSVDGTPISGDLTSMPHLLIAGTTGSGKSVCVNAIIGSLLLNNSPQRLKFIMVDPKRVELTPYNGIPHLVAPVVVEVERILSVLKWVTREMDERYRKFSANSSRNIEDYNKHLPQGEDPLPYIVVIIDELADLMMQAPEEAERVITRIAALARATGIHLVIATQRPSVDVVTGLIKANFPARIAFAVAGNTDSRVILDQPGAERLLGRGDMLYVSGDAPAPVRLQGVFVSDTEINNITRYWRSQMTDEDMIYAARPLSSVLMDADDRAEAAQQRREDGGSGNGMAVAFWDRERDKQRPSNGLGDDDDEVDDEIYDRAVDLVRRENKASVSLLQRKLRIGYTRAARLIDIMEERGIVGPAIENSSKPREVLRPHSTP